MSQCVWDQGCESRCSPIYHCFAPSFRQVAAPGRYRDFRDGTTSGSPVLTVGFLVFFRIAAVEWPLSKSALHFPKFHLVPLQLCHDGCDLGFGLCTDLSCDGGPWDVRAVPGGFCGRQLWRSRGTEVQQQYLATFLEHLKFQCHNVSLIRFDVFDAFLHLFQ